MSLSYRVTASDRDGEARLIATRITNRREADRLAVRWIGRADIASVHVAAELMLAIEPTRRRAYR